MVKRLTLLLLLIAGGARAAVHVTTQDTLLSRMTFAATDEIIIASGDSVYIDSTWSQTTVSLARFFVRQGGALIGNASKGILVNAVWLGGDAAAPYSSTNGGRLELKQQSYLGIRYSATWPKSITIGANALFEPSINGGINGTNCAVIYCDNPATYGLAGIYVENSSASFKPRGVRFRQMYPGGFNGGGIDINASGRVASLTDIAQCYFDTTNIRFITSDGIRIDSCYFRVPSTGVNQAIRLNGSDNDTIWGCQIYVEGVNQGCKGIYATNSAAPYIRATKIWEDQGSVFSASSYGIYYEGTGRIILSNDTLYGFGFTFASNNGGNGTLQVDSCKFYMGPSTHESIITHDAGDSILVRSSLFYGRVGGGQSIITAYANSGTGGWVGCYYNTFDNGAFGFSPTAFCVGLEYGGSGSVTYNNIDFVGNIMLGRHATYSLAGLGVGPTGTGAVTVNLRQFKNNAYKAVYVKSGSSVSYPYTATDSNKVTSAYGFIDSANGDYRLDAASPMLNCGDSTYAIGVFGSAQASKAPFDIGYYQSYTTGTCGGGSPTPTGACCISYTCYTGYTAAQCSTAGGTYQGNGTTTCTGCTVPGGGVGTGYGKRAWATFATLNYGDASWNLSSLAPFVARNFDLSVNISGAFEDSVTVLDPNIGKLNYMTLSSYITSSTDTSLLRTFCNARGYIFDSCFIWTNGTTACINAIAPNGTPCTDVGGNMCSTHGNKVAFCGWNTYRLTPNFRYVGTQQFIIYKVLLGAKNKGIMQDEACYVWQDTLTHSGSNSPWFPYPGYWSSGSAANTNAWTGSGLSNTQIADSLIHLKRSGWLAALMDSLQAHGQQNYANGAAYGRMTSDLAGDMAILGSGMLFGEGMDISFTDGAGAFYPAMAWTLMDSLRTGTREWQNGNAIIWTNINAADTVTLTAIDGALGMKRRLAQERYTWYLMAGTPLRSFLFISLNWGGLGHQNGWSQTTDSLFKYCPSMDANLGAPSGGRTILSSGTGGTVYQRSFANGKVLWRDGSGGSYTAANAITVALGATYYPVNYDGSYGAATSTASIRNGEGLIFLTSTAASTGNASIDDATVTEGGTMTFTVTLSAAQSVLTTINYSTANGTALSGTDYTAVTSGSKSIPIGATSTTITVSTTNRSGCQASRAFTVTFNVTSPTTITVTDPIGTGTITDDDCGVTIGKSYKGKTVIKGEVNL